MGFASAFATVAAWSISDMPLAGQIALKSVRIGSGVVFAVRLTNGLKNEIRMFLTRRKFARYLTDIYNWENHQYQKEKLPEKIWGILKDFMFEAVFRIECRITEIPDDHSFQEVFKLFKGNEKYGFTLLNLETTAPSAQDAAQISLMLEESDTTLPTTDLDCLAMGCRARRL